MILTIEFSVEIKIFYTTLQFLGRQVVEVSLSSNLLPGVRLVLNRAFVSIMHSGANWESET